MTRLISPCFLFVALLSAAPGGQYGGTWTSDGGANSGRVSITLTAGADGAWQSDFTFTYQDQVVKPGKVTVKIEKDQVEFLCETDLEGFRLKTAFQGSIDGTKMAGKYRTTSLDDGSAVDSGKWEVTQKQ